MVMLSPALTKEEGERYSMLFDKYPKLFATEYTQMRGTYSVWIVPWAFVSIASPTIATISLSR